MNRTFDEDENFVFDSTRSHRPDKSLKRNSPINLPIIKAKRRKSLQTTPLTSIIKKYLCIGKNVIATSITKNSDLSFQVKLKEQNKTFREGAGLEIYCSCNKNERTDRKTCVHIVWCLNKLCKKDLSDEIIAQVSLEHHELLSLDPPSERPVIHTENERSFHDKIITKILTYNMTGLLM